MQQCSILNLKLYFCHQDDKELFDNQTYANCRKLEPLLNHYLH